MKRFLYLIIFVIFTTACEEVFEDPPQAFVVASFMDSGTTKAIYSNISVRGVGQEDFWVTDTLLQKIILPLSANDTTHLLISFDAKVDTVTLVHDTFQKYDSMETGFYFEYKIKSISSTNHRIDYIELTDSLVTKDWHENIQFYLHPVSAGRN